MLTHGRACICVSVNVEMVSDISRRRPRFCQPRISAAYEPICQCHQTQQPFTQKVIRPQSFPFQRTAAMLRPVRTPNAPRTRVSTSIIAVASRTQLKHEFHKLRSRHYATGQKDAVSIPDNLTGFFNWPNPCSRTMALGSIQRLTEINSRNLPGLKGGRGVRLTTLPPSVSRLPR
jgi:hypothetical protein